MTDSSKVYAVGSGTQWDHRRNTSEVRGGSVSAAETLRALAHFRVSSPAHAAWIEDGYPTLTEAEHLARFGEAYERRGTRAVSTNKGG